MSLNYQVMIYQPVYEIVQGEQRYKHSNPQDKRFFFRTPDGMARWLQVQQFADHQMYSIWVFEDTEEEHRNRGSKNPAFDSEWPEDFYMPMPTKEKADELPDYPGGHS